MQFIYALLGVIMLVCGFAGIISLVADAHKNGEEAAEGTERAGDVEVRGEQHVR